MPRGINSISDNYYSDYNSSEYTAQIIATNTYQDIHRLFIHPQKKDVLLATDLEAIRNSIINIVRTPIGTRPFYPKFGTEIEGLLFENFGWPTARALEDRIVDAIKKFEKRISKVEVNAEPFPDENLYRITITFAPFYESLVTIELILNRIR